MACFGTAGGNVSIRSIPVTWAPGMGAVEFPEDFGLYLASTDVIVVQRHYNMVDPATHGQTDSTRVDLRTEPVVERPASYALPEAFLDSACYGDPEIIPPGEEAHVFSFSGAGWQLAASAPDGRPGHPQHTRRPALADLGPCGLAGGARVDQTAFGEPQ